MLVAPQSKFNDIIFTLKEIEARNRRLVFELNKYKRVAEDLIKTNATHGYILFGAIACLEHNLPEMHRNHNMAIAEDYSVFTLKNYKASLELSCLWEKSFEYALKCCECDPSSPELLDTAISILPLMGKFSAASSLLSKWKKLKKRKAHKLENFFLNFSEFSKITDITESDLMEFLSFVSDILSKSTIYITSYAYNFYKTDDDLMYLFYNFTLPKNDNNIFNYENMLEEAITNSKFSTNLKEYVVFNFSDDSINVITEAIDADINLNSSNLHHPSVLEFALIDELVEGVEI